MIVHAHAQPRKPDRVLLLGAGGFIGGALKRQLEANSVNVLGLNRTDVELSHLSAVGKLTATLEPSDAVVMLAAVTPDKGRDIATMMKNLAMMQHLCTALAEKGCAHLVYFSSDAVYGLATDLVSEETPPSPQDLYGAMHLARELMARSLSKVPALILRPTAVCGADDTHNGYGPNRFRRSAQKEGKIQLFGGGEETRDHIHVNDVAAIAARCLLHRSTGTLNLATGRSLPFHEVARIVSKQSSKPVEIVSASRANPITHRHYDVTSLIKAFPGLRFTALEEAA